MKKILIFIDWYIPAYKAGGPIISVKNIIDHLSTQFDFYIITSNLDIDKKKVTDDSDLNKWISRKNYEIIYLNSKNQNIAFYNKIINDLHPEIIYLNSFFSYKFSILPILVSRKNKYNIKIILAPRGMLGDGALKIKRFKKVCFLKFMKFIGFYSNIHWHASTNNESVEIQNFFGTNSKITIAQNLSTINEKLKFKVGKLEDGFLTILYLSRVSKKKNLFFLIQSIILSEKKSKIKLKIIGFCEDELYFKSCIDLINENQIDYELLGTVPHEQLPKYYLSSDIFCLPTLHENYGHVIVEALSYGLPIIISQNTPWRNLENNKVGFDLPLLSSSFSSKIDYFFSMDDSAFSTYSKNAINFYKDINPINKLVKDNINLFS
ncbi:MAG: glycosyltransferase [Parvicellaceae bacterium]